MRSLATRRFGVSTHLFHGQRLSREHLLEIAAHGFESVELFATRTHFDYHSPAAVGRPAAVARRRRARAARRARAGRATASSAGAGAAADAGERRRRRARARASPRPSSALLHRAPHSAAGAGRRTSGVPRTQIGVARPTTAATARGAASRSCSGWPRRSASSVAVEVIPERAVARRLAGALRRGRPRRAGRRRLPRLRPRAHGRRPARRHRDGVGSLITTHVHDNRGRTDDHLVPFDGTIDWPAAMTAVQKVGYDQTLLFEIAAHGSPKDTLVAARRRAREAGTAAGGLVKHQADAGLQAFCMPRSRARTSMISSEQRCMHVYIEDIGKHEGDEVTLKGWLHNRRSSGKIHFLIVRDGSGFIQAVMSKAGRRRRDVQDGRSSVAGDRRDRHRHRPRRQAGAERLRDRRQAIRGRRGVARLSRFTPKEHGVDYLLDRRHLWIAQRAPAGDPARCRHEIINAVRRFSSTASDRVRCLARHADLHAGALARARRRCFRAGLSRETAYLTQSGQLYDEAYRHGARPKCTRFGPTFRAENSRRHGATSRNSGWSSRRWPTPISTT